MVGLLKVPGASVFLSLGPEALTEGKAALGEEKTVVFDMDGAGVEGAIPLDQCKEAPVSPAFFETIIKALASEDEKTQCVIISKNVRLASLGLVCCCALKGVQTINKMRSLVAEGIAEKDWIEAIVTNQFETESFTPEDSSDFLKGNFDIVKALDKKMPESKVGKMLVDKMVDLVGQLEGEPKSGVNVRRLVVQLQTQLDSSTGDSALAVKGELLEALERYFYTVCLGTYLREQGPQGFSTPWSSWLGERPFLLEMVEAGVRVWKEITFFSLNMSQPA